MRRSDFFRRIAESSAAVIAPVVLRAIPLATVSTLGATMALEEIVELDVPEDCAVLSGAFPDAQGAASLIESGFKSVVVVFKDGATSLIHPLSGYAR